MAKVGQIIETKIDRWDGGIINDARDPRENVAKLVSNFDIVKNPRKMTPHNSSESGDDTSALERQNFAIALRTGTTYSLYALGVKSGASTAEVYYKDINTGGSNDLGDNSWTETANNESSAGAGEFNLFVYYAKTGMIYGSRVGRFIWEYDPAGSTAWNDSDADLTSYTNIGQGLVHSKDDILYVPYDNKIAKNDNGTWTTTALTLPSHLVITSISEYGNYLAIACAPLSGFGNSIVYLWDRDASLETLSESIDWGTGSLMILGEIDGELVGISQVGGAATITANMPGPSTAGSFGDRVIFRRLAGNKAVKFLELTGGSNTTKLPIAKQKIDNRLYFSMLIEYEGAVRDGVWSLGRNTAESPISLVHERTSNNNTALETGDNPQNFILVGDYVFITYSDSGTMTTTKTTSGSAYAHNAIYRSKVFDAGDSSLKKDLIGVSVMTEYLPSSGSVTLGYRKNEETSYTTILTHDADDEISDSAVNIESSGAALPKDYKEIQFELVATGANAEITGFSFRERVVGKRPY